MHEPEPQDRVEWFLRPLFSAYQVIEFGAGTIFRGPTSPYCEQHRREVEQGLRQLPGAYCFERIGDTAHLTYTMPGPRWRPTNRPLHVGLLLATVLTTLIAGADWRFDQFLGALGAALTGTGGDVTLAKLFEQLVTLGGPFSVAILLILGTHECGHYLMARRYGMLVTPPFFLPAPIPPIGTFGAVIKIRSPMMHRRALLDIGLAGPLAGLAVALPILAYGLAHSEFVLREVIERQAGVQFGHSLLTWGLTRAFLGVPPPGYELNWLGHPMAWAGWIGLLVTSLNLMPVGQLDGGHVAYALMGRRQHRVAFFVLGVLLALATVPRSVSAYHWRGWLVWCVLILFIVKTAHPPVVVEEVSLGWGRRILGWATLVLLLLIFVPVPATGMF